MRPICARKMQGEAEFEMEQYLDAVGGHVDVSQSRSVLISENGNAFDALLAVETLRLSDYMVGSAKSNAFRLGMEFQFARNWPRAGYRSEQTAFSVDVAWLQDP